MDEQATWIACLTPPGRSAIATLGLRGPRSWKCVHDLFQPKGRELPETPSVGQFWFGQLGEQGRGAADEVVLAVRRMEPCPWVEVHCHGGPEVIRMLLEVFAVRGAQVCTWQELELRTGQDPLRTQAQSALVQAPTVRTAVILLDQFHGAFAHAVAQIEAALSVGRVDEAAVQLAKLDRYIPLGRHLTQPWRVVIAGATNVGKSSLINALAGYERSVVDPSPGTTRDVVTTLTAIDGWPVELADTAGWRSDPEALEKAGLELARTAVAQADLCLWVLDGSAFPVWPEPAILNVRYVINKCDLPPAWNWDELPTANRVSAKTGSGVSELCQALAHWLVPILPEPGAAVPFTPELCDAVQEMLRLCGEGHVEGAAQVLKRLPHQEQSANAGPKTISLRPPAR